MCLTLLRPVCELYAVEVPEGEAHPSLREIAEATNQGGFDEFEKAKHNANILVREGLVPRFAIDRKTGRIVDSPKANGKSLKGDPVGVFLSKLSQQERDDNKGIVDEHDRLTEKGQRLFLNAMTYALVGESNPEVAKDIINGGETLGIDAQMRALMTVTPDILAVVNDKAKRQYDIRRALGEALDWFLRWRKADKGARVAAGMEEYQWRARKPDGTLRNSAAMATSWENYRQDLLSRPGPEAEIIGDMLAASERAISYDKEGPTEVGKRRAHDLIVGYVGDYLANVKAAATEEEGLLGLEVAPPTALEMLEAQRKGRFSVGLVDDASWMLERHGDALTDPDTFHDELLSGIVTTMRFSVGGKYAEMDDRALADEYAGGDDIAFAALYERYSDKVVRTLQNKEGEGLGASEDVAEIVAAAFWRRAARELREGVMEKRKIAFATYYAHNLRWLLADYYAGRKTEDMDVDLTSQGVESMDRRVFDGSDSKTVGDRIADTRSASDADFEANEDRRRKVKLLMSVLDAEDRTLISALMSGKSMSAIAREAGVTMDEALRSFRGIQDRARGIIKGQAASPSGATSRTGYYRSSRQETSPGMSQPSGATSPGAVPRVSLQGSSSVDIIAEKEKRNLTRDLSWLAALPPKMRLVVEAIEAEPDLKNVDVARKLKLSASGVDKYVSIAKSKYGWVRPVKSSPYSATQRAVVEMFEAGESPDVIASTLGITLANLWNQVRIAKLKGWKEADEIWSRFRKKPGRPASRRFSVAPHGVQKGASVEYPDAADELRALSDATMEMGQRWSVWRQRWSVGIAPERQKDADAAVEALKNVRTAASVEDAGAVLKESGSVNKPLTNKILGITAKITGNSLSKMISEKATKKSKSPYLHALAVANADKIFECAFCDATHADTHGRKEVEKVHRLGSMLHDPKSGMFEPVLVTVIEYKRDGENVYTLEVVDVDAYEKSDSAGQLVAFADGKRQTPIAEYVRSIAQRVRDFNHAEAIKRGDMVAASPTLREDVEAALLKRDAAHPDAMQKGRHDEIVFSENIPVFEFLGLPNRRVVTEVSKIRKFAIKHHLSVDQIVDIPNGYDSPVAIMRDEDGYVLLTDRQVTTDDGEQKPMRLFLRPTKWRSGEIVLLATAMAENGRDELEYYEPRLEAGLMFADENRIAGLNLGEETESILRIQASGDNVKTAADFSAWKSTQESIAKSAADGKGPRYSIGARRRAEFRNLLLRKRPDIAHEDIEAYLDEIAGYESAKKQKLAVHWLITGAIELPEDAYKLDKAIATSERAKVDPFQYSNPEDIFAAFPQHLPKDPAIDPDTVPELTGKTDMGHGITVYNVSEKIVKGKRRAGQVAMRKVINTHWGKDASPWCLLQGDGNGELTEQSRGYWEHYSALPKKVAFLNGKLLAFMATSGDGIQYAPGALKRGEVILPDEEWWDRKDASHDGIPIEGKIAGDALGRSGLRELKDGELKIVGRMWKGDRKNGMYEEWAGEQKALEEERKDGRMVWRRTYRNGELSMVEHYNEKREHDRPRLEFYPGLGLAGYVEFGERDIPTLNVTFRTDGTLRSYGRHESPDGLAKASVQFGYDSMSVAWTDDAGDYYSTLADGTGQLRSAEKIPNGYYGKQPVDLSDAALRAKLEGESAAVLEAVKAEAAAIYREYSAVAGAAQDGTRWSVAALSSGERVVILDRAEEIAKINLNDPKSLHDYLVGKVGEELFDNFVIGTDAPDEYVYSKDAQGNNKRVRKAKAKLATGLDEAAAAAGEASTEPAAHKEREGGVYYRRGFLFAAPSGFSGDYRAYSADMISYKENGVEQFYDVVNIEDAPSVSADLTQMSARIATNGTSRMPADGGATPRSIPNSAAADNPLAAIANAKTTREVEAYLAQARSRMSDLQRASDPPWETEKRLLDAISRSVGINIKPEDVRWSIGTAWRPDFPAATAQTTRAYINGHYAELFKRAKAGDVEAAEELVEKVCKVDKIRQLGKDHPNARIVAPVVAYEATGHNMIPRRYAEYIASILGIEVDDGIVQTVRAGHTGADALHRLFTNPEFDGEVVRGAEYIIVDDHITQGGTVNALRDHIERNGGKVVAVAALTLSQGSSILSPRKDTLDELYAKWPDIDNLLRIGNIAESAGALTESQAKYILKFSPDTFRDRAVAQGVSRGRVALQGALGASPSEEVSRRKSQRFSAARSFPGLNEMTGDEQLVAALAAKAVIHPQLATSTSRTRTPYGYIRMSRKAVEELVRRSHPEIANDYSAVSSAAAMFAMRAQMLARDFRKALEGGVSEQEILRRLPKKMEPVYRRQIAEAFRKGGKVSEYGMRAERGLRERIDRMEKRRVAEESGVETGLFETWAGIDFAATLAKVLYDPRELEDGREDGTEGPELAEDAAGKSGGGRDGDGGDGHADGRRTSGGSGVLSDRGVGAVGIRGGSRA